MAGSTVIKTSDGKHAVRFTGPDARRRTLRVGAYQQTAESIARRIDGLLDRRLTGDPMKKDLAEWVETLSAPWRTKLTKWGLLDPTSSAAAVPIEQHVEDFERHLIADPKRATRAPGVARRVRVIAAKAGLVRLSEITPAAVELALAALKEDGLASNTLLSHRQAIIAFCKWAARERRIPAFPLAGLQTISAAAERERKALDFDEQRWLLAATAAGPSIVHRATDGTETVSTGEERALAYELVLGTGLRNKEVHALRAGWFSLTATQPTLRLPARSEKARRGYTFTIQPHLAKRLRAQLANKSPAAPAFALPRRDFMAIAIRRDLAAARSAWIDAAGQDHEERQRREKSLFLCEKDAEGAVFDFHSLRVSFVTNLARAGVSLFHASKLARHTDPKLTARIYAKLGIVDQAEAVSKLPDLTLSPEPMRAKATGTDAPRATPALQRAPAKGLQLSATGADDPDSTPPEPLVFSGVAASCPQMSASGNSHLRDLNPGPMLYESIALPLS
jgi:integrase/recombinase XerC